MVRGWPAAGLVDATAGRTAPRRPPGRLPGVAAGGAGGELDPDTPEPRVPHGLDGPSASLAALISFLRVDPDLLAAAAEAGVEDAGEMERFRSWVSGSPRGAAAVAAARRRQSGPGAWLGAAGRVPSGTSAGGGRPGPHRRAVARPRRGTARERRHRSIRQGLRPGWQTSASGTAPRRVPRGGDLPGDHPRRWVAGCGQDDLRRAAAGRSRRVGAGRAVPPRRIAAVCAGVLVREGPGCARRYRAAGATEAGRFTFPSARDSADDFFSSRLMTAASDVVVIEGDSRCAVRIYGYSSRRRRSRPDAAGSRAA